MPETAEIRSTPPHITEFQSPFAPPADVPMIDRGEPSKEDSGINDINHDLPVGDFPDVDNSDLLHEGPSSDIAESSTAAALSREQAQNQ